MLEEHLVHLPSLAFTVAALAVVIMMWPERRRFVHFMGITSKDEAKSDDRARRFASAASIRNLNSGEQRNRNNVRFGWQFGSSYTPILAGALLRCRSGPTSSSGCTPPIDLGNA
jgi:hypothetical protein